MFSKYQKETFVNQACDREWTSLSEAIGTSGGQLSLFVILKGKR